jgi:high-affinity Fe2+/Pb2+ permease
MTVAAKTMATKSETSWYRWGLVVGLAIGSWITYTIMAALT